jgi:hypothetical protein
MEPPPVEHRNLAKRGIYNITTTLETREDTPLASSHLVEQKVIENLPNMLQGMNATMNIDLQNQGYSNMFPMFKGYTFLHAK